MKVSVALCTYNGEKFLKEQLESFLNQTQLPDEIIICDDSSTDSTPEILKDFQKLTSFPVLIEINQKQLGVVKNFEKAIGLCTGEIIFLSDQDDIWMQDKIETIIYQFKQNKDLGMVFTNAELINENSEKLDKTLFDEIFKRTDETKSLFEICLKKNVVTGATMAFRQTYRESFLPIPTHIPNIIHDAWITLVISAIAECKCLEKPLIKYRQHSNQQLGLFGKTYQNTIENLKEEITTLQNFPEYFDNKIILKKLAENKDLIDKLIVEKTELIKHYETRMNLPQNRLKRILPIFSEIITGRYGKFSNGIKSAIKDTFENKSNLK